MKRHRIERVRAETLVAYLEEEVTPRERMTLEKELADSPRARRQLEALHNLRSSLSAGIPELGEVDLVPALQKVRASGGAPASVRGRARSWYYALMVAATFALLVGGGAALLQPGRPEFRVKSADVTEGARERWAGIRVYRVEAGGGAPERLADGMRSSDGLLFSYTNLGGEPFDYLMIFGVDARGEVHWFHPAYEREGTNPASIPIEKSQSNVPLPELIRHDFPPGPLAIHALFTTWPVRALDVERSLSLSRDPAAALALSGAVDQVVRTQVRMPESQTP